MGALDALKSAPHLLALTHFDDVLDRRKAYGSDLFKALRYLVTEERKLVLLAESRMPARELLPGKDSASSLAALLQVVELRQTKA